MSTPHVIASSSGHPWLSFSSNNGIVGGHYRVGKKIGEGSFGVVFDGLSLFSAAIGSMVVSFKSFHVWSTMHSTPPFVFNLIVSSPEFIIILTPILTLLTGAKVTTSQPVAVKFVRNISLAY